MITVKQFAFDIMCGLALISRSLADDNSATVAKTIRPGDEAVVVVAEAPLMRGHATLATVTEGQRLRVLKVEGPWVGTTVTVNGAKIGGWIWNQQLATPRQYQAMRQNVRRSYSYQPAPAYRGPYQGYYRGAPASSQPFIMGETPYNGSYWRADRKITGY